jgi:hypothetical protein
MRVAIDVFARSDGRYVAVLYGQVSRDRDKDAKIIRRMRAEGDSYAEIAEATGRTKSDIYRVCMTLGCQPDCASTASPISLVGAEQFAYPLLTAAWEVCEVVKAFSDPSTGEKYLKPPAGLVGAKLRLGVGPLV